MAESQLLCLDDDHIIHAAVPESKPEFYYSEEHRVALEELLRNGDGAFKTLLKEDLLKTDFLSARELKWIRSVFQEYKEERDDARPETTATETQNHSVTDGNDSGLHSTYWPTLSDTEVPMLDLGWPNSGFFRGVTRVAVHTHPPKDSGPHVKEVVRRLIQEANKVIAIVMDLLTDVQILQDLMDAASRRSVPVYILLDVQGMPHFLDMCSRLHIGAQHLKNLRVRTLVGPGLGLSFGRLPGSVCNKYMIIDGDKVMFGSYSFSWMTSRVDRHMITVMTGQVVDVYDRDFRELYAVSDQLDLYKEFHVNTPPTKLTPSQSRTLPKRPPLPATTSRFQVSLGDSQNVAGAGGLQVPAHKYHNPKYFLVFGDPPRPTHSLQGTMGRRETLAGVPEDPYPERTRTTSSMRAEKVTTLPMEVEEEHFGSIEPIDVIVGKKPKSTWKQKLKWRSSNRNIAAAGSVRPTTPPTAADGGWIMVDEEHSENEVTVRGNNAKWRSKKSSKGMGAKTDSLQTVGTTQEETQSLKSQKRSKKSGGCTQS